VTGGSLAKCGTLWQPTLSNDQHGGQANLWSWRYALKMPCQHTTEIPKTPFSLMQNPQRFDYSTSARKQEKQTTARRPLWRGVPAVKQLLSLELAIEISNVHFLVQAGRLNEMWPYHKVRIHAGYTTALGNCEFQHHVIPKVANMSSVF